MQAALALLGIGLALISLSIQFSRAGIGWFLFVMAAAIVSMYSAFEPRLRDSPLGAILGFVLLIAGGVGLAVGGPHQWLAFTMVCFGLAYIGIWAAIELPKGRHAHWSFQKRGTVH